MIGRLRNRSIGELAFRGRQAISARLERVGLVPAAVLRSNSRFLRELGPGFNDTRDLARWFRDDAPAAVLAGAWDPAATAGAVARVHPQEGARLREEADSIARGRFDLLGHRALWFGDPIDWTLDPTTGVRPPRHHWSRIDHLDRHRAGDHKVIWELNRQQSTHLLVRAWLLTGDRRYADLAVRHLESWIDGNPPKLGINWVSSLEVSYRSIAWLWTLLWLRREYSLPPDLLSRVVQVLAINGRHLETHLSTYYSPNTHLTGEALGLLYLGTLLPILPGSERWRRVGWRTLTEQLDRHVERDGTYFERSTYYHRYTTDIYTHALLLGEASGVSENDCGAVRTSVERLLGHSLALTRPDGGTPLIGDDDGGHLWMPRYDRPGDFRPSLSTGAVLLGRGDMAYAAGQLDAETIWLLGPDAIDRWEGLQPATPTRLSQGFPDGGYYVLRDGWSATSSYMVVDAGRHGALNCGHAHADALSLELGCRGGPVLVDPGTFSYADLEARNRFRSTAAHNTLTIEGAGPSVPAGAFQWSRATDAQCVRWIAGVRFDHLIGEHDGFRFEEGSGAHRREILFAHQVGWLIRDRAEAPEGRKAVLRFQCAPGKAVSCRPAPPGALMVTIYGEDGSGAVLDMFSWARGVSGALVDAWVSPIHGRRERAHAWVVEAAVGQDMISLLLPRGAGASAPVVFRDEVPGGVRLTLEQGEARHEILLGDGALIETDSVKTDARLAWCRIMMAGADIAAADASRVEMEGLPLPLAGPERTAWVEAESRRGAWRIHKLVRTVGAAAAGVNRARK